MLTGMKPLPKALIIFLPIALAVWVSVKFMPEKKVEPVVTPIAAQVVPAEQPKFESQSGDPSAKAETVQVSPVPVTEDNSQSEGMKALLQKGKK